MSHEREPLLTPERNEEESAVTSPQATLSHHDRHDKGKFTYLEKILSVMSVTMFVLLCVFVGLYSRRVYNEIHRLPIDRPKAPRYDNGSEPVCSTPECVLAASDVIKDMDRTADPCQDFFAYTCGGWMSHNEIEEGRSSAGNFRNLDISNKIALRSIISEEFEDFYKRTHGSESQLPDPDTLLDKQNFEVVKKLYGSCMNEASIDRRGPSPLYPLLRQVKSMASASNVKDLTRTLALMAKNSVGALFELSVDADPKDPDRNTISVIQSGLTLPSKEYYESPDMTQALFESVADTMEAVLKPSGIEFGWAQRSANITARLVVDFEKRLANISDYNEIFGDPLLTYNPQTLSQLAQLSPSFDWGLYVSNMLPSTAPHPDTLVVTSLDYLAKLSDQLKKTTDREFEAYVMWHVIRSYTPALGEDMRLPLQKLYAKLSGTNAKVTKPRWDTCLDKVSDSLGFLAGRYFVLDKFNGDAKEKATGFVESITRVFLDRLPLLTWLDADTREKAVEKVGTLSLKIGYPAQFPDTNAPVSLSDYYSGLQVGSDDYFENYLNSNQWYVKKMWENVGKPTERAKWFMNPQEVNAYYSPSFNEIVFPAGILQAPFFDTNYPEYLNYGGIGMVVGHELTHGFDNSGRQFDARGHLEKWWTNQTSDAFDEKAQCFIDQYSNFTFKDTDGTVLNNNGKMTLGENLADNGGLRESYLAWRDRFEKDPKSKVYNNVLLPGLDGLSRDQLFFVNYGRVWCGKSTNAAIRQKILTDVHAIDRWRVNGAVQNSKYFTDAYQCPLGSPMNPVKKCEIW
ncbi:hypothetical protein BDF14DRAFT_1779617 [Spinellus fusiger]|nr:hypothetical protein BDF14DRAFT_1779617 [Spinellus fusiger]